MLYQNELTVTLTVSEWISVRCAITSEAVRYLDEKCPATAERYRALRNAIGAQTDSAVDAAMAELDARNARNAA